MKTLEDLCVSWAIVHLDTVYLSVDIWDLLEEIEECLEEDE